MSFDEMGFNSKITSSPMICRRNLLPYVFFLLLFSSISVRGELVGCEFIPPENWAYKALERFEVLGLCDLPSIRPYTRREIISLISQISNSINSLPISLSPRDTYNLRRLKHEFSSLPSQADPKRRYDPPLVIMHDVPIILEGDLDVALAPERKAFESKTDFFIKGHPQGKLHYGTSVTYEFRYRLVFGPEWGKRSRNEKPSRRERSFKGLTSLFERSYIIFEKSRATFSLGREYMDWGPSRHGNLLISSTSGSFDRLQGRLKIGRLSLSFIHAALSLESKRYLAAHRAEVNWRHFQFGISESVVYEGRGWDPVYSFPLSSFYANQFNEKGDDNVLWSLDFKGRPGKGVLFFGSFLVDDFQFERDGSAPDKTAFDVGIRIDLARPVAVSSEIFYRFIDIYTYTHRDTFTQYVSGKPYPYDPDALIGASEGPDSDRLSLEITIYPRANTSFALGISSLRRGEGNDFGSYEPREDTNPPFPSGIVERETNLSMLLDWEMEGGSEILFEGGWERISNRNHVQGNDVDDTYFRIALLWDF